MGKKLPGTPRSRVRSALRQVWLRSRERSAAIKRAANTCERCGKKGSAARGKEVSIEVHHKHGIRWDELVDLVYQHLLVHPDQLEVLCSDCHGDEHDMEVFR